MFDVRWIVLCLFRSNWLPNISIETFCYYLTNVNYNDILTIKQDEEDEEEELYGRRLSAKKGLFYFSCSFSPYKELSSFTECPFV